MSGNILVLCDAEEEYVRQMAEFLRGHREAPWDLHTFTDVDGMLAFAAENKIKILVAAESVYEGEVSGIQAEKTVLLNESGVVRWKNIRNVNKYQEAENVYREILGEYTETAKDVLPRLAPEGGSRLIGMFSPVHRSLQTTFALTMGQMLAGKYATLYLNFEYCAGTEELLADVRTRDLADLVYFLNTDRERFLLRMQTVILKKGQMDYVPPVKAGMTLLEIRAEEWIEMLTVIAQSGKYEYIVLDLSESVQGLLEILRMCHRIYTLSMDDRAARGKIAQYERLLDMTDNADLLEKTSRYRLPRFRRLPEEIEQYTKGELADYVGRILGEVTSCREST